MTLRELRAAIDDIDDRLVMLLNERAGLALHIGRWKRARGLPVYDPKREGQVLKRVRRRAHAAGGPLDGSAVARVFERVIDEARQIELTDGEARPGALGRTDHGSRDGRAGDGSRNRARRRRTC
jgi:chorismate mutase